MQHGKVDSLHETLVEAVGIAESPSCGDVVRVILAVDGHRRILQTDFHAFACASAMTRTADTLQAIRGKTVDEARAIAEKSMKAELSPENGNGGCIAAEQAVLAALGEYAVRCRDISRS